MKKVKFIYNPNSGDRSIVEKLDDIFKKYQCNGYTVVPYRISRESSLEDSIKDIDKTYDHILIAGGDGTINQVINLIKSQNIDIPIGVLPTGTANDFANMLKIPSNINKALDKIINSKPKKIDLGKANDSFFVNVASAGMFTDVSQKIDPNFKNSLGRISYIIKGMEEVVNLKNFNISVKSKELNYKGDMYLILVLNGSTAGNINLAHSSMIDDGLLDVIIFKTMPLQKTIPVLRRIIKGLPIDTFDEIIYFKTNELSINCKEDISTDIDGEKGPCFPLNIKCEHNALEVRGLKINEK